jgi:DNA polymerase-3 subunit epsilon
VFLATARGRAGEWRPQLLLASELGDQRRQEQLYGPFKTATRSQADPDRTGEASTASLPFGLLGLEKVKPGKPCFAHQLQQCKGACVGKEPVSFHSARLMAALGRHRLSRTWPFAGPAWLREGDEVH